MFPTPYQIVKLSLPKIFSVREEHKGFAELWDNLLKAKGDKNRAANTLRGVPRNHCNRAPEVDPAPPKVRRFISSKLEQPQTIPVPARPNCPMPTHHRTTIRKMFTVGITKTKVLETADKDEGGFKRVLEEMLVERGESRDRMPKTMKSIRDTLKAKARSELLDEEFKQRVPS